MRFLSNKRAIVAGAAALLAVATLAGCSASNGAAGATAEAGQGTYAKSSDTLVFGAVPDQAGSDSNWKPVEDYIAKKTGKKVEFYPTSDYTALIAAAVAGKVDIASFSGLTYVQAVNKGAKLGVASAVVSSPGLKDPGYYSEAIVPKGSPITKLADFAGKKICFVDPNSTSGFLFPLLALSKAGLSVKSSGTDASGNPKFSDFTASFAGAHDKSVQSIATKQCDAGFAEDTEADAAAKKGQVTVIDKQYVPGGPLVYSKALPSAEQTKLTSIMKSITVDDITAAGISTSDGFTSTFFGAIAEKDSYYKSIRDICTQVPAAECAS
ncbi:phosphate-import protein PhnD [Frondihabitans sucicola]|uniref:Phosphate-import protein PhnD n=1 Tax=Frondihabitans sucicola TaxID=1268041 RepID=A0ABM8GT13_9MICO|nr:phosphate/phosphite/phosphonate ABC transporter substrate-binding protein [Frondihabitans sucicola]BDZ51432.1 phosphate-import protein PhnD [Frondihabitans sucicola]